MRSNKTRRRLSVAVILAGLMGCAGGPSVVSASSRDIELRWYTDEGSIDAATAQAESRCLATNRHAVLEEEFQDQDITIARFACR